MKAKPKDTGKIEKKVCTGQTIDNRETSFSLPSGRPPRTKSKDCLIAHFNRTKMRYFEQLSNSILAAPQRKTGRRRRSNSSILTKSDSTTHLPQSLSSQSSHKYLCCAQLPELSVELEIQIRPGRKLVLRIYKGDSLQKLFRAAKMHPLCQDLTGSELERLFNIIRLHT